MTRKAYDESTRARVGVSVLRILVQIVSLGDEIAARGDILLVSSVSYNPQYVGDVEILLTFCDIVVDGWLGGGDS